MTKFIHKIGGMVAGVAFGALAFTSCSEQIDESNLYTFTGETITDYLRSDSTLSDFAKITEYAGLSDRLSAYGTYTCFAPTNEAVKEYIQELWEDKKSANHNGLYTGDVSEGNTIDRLWKSEKRDSLCKDIVEAHLTGLKKTSNDLLTGSDITMMGGNTHSPKRVGDDITIDGTTKIINRDHEVENGVVHTIDKLFYRSTNYIIDEMENMGIYSIWCDALKQTGLDEVMKEHIRTNGISWFTIDPETKYPFAEYPTSCKVGFTVFAETDKVLQNKGITNWKELAAKANEWYKDCASWYSYLEDHPEIKISTGTDYTNQWNTLNMFLRYHILKYSLSMDKLVYSYNELEYADVYEYVRTLLPYTMFKLTGVKENGAVGSIWINRVLNNPTLTSSPGANSKSAYEEAYKNSIKENGIKVGGSSTVLSRQASNGWIHPIDDILCYEAKVPNEVLNERMRFEFMSLLDESMTNQFRGYSYLDFSSKFGRSDKKIGAIRFPKGYFENMVIYNGESSRIYYLAKDEAKTLNNGFNPGNWDCWLDYQGDELFVRGAYDFAIKLPPVPKDGTYELRFGYVITGARTMVQFSLGHSSDRFKMTTCDIPLDQREGIESTTIGWTDPDKDGDLGAATDKSMHNRGWMRGPNYFSNYKKGAEGTARTNISRQPHIRRVVTKQFFKQGEDNWFRCKTAMPEDTEAEFELDYIEIVPVSVYNHPTLTEDVF